jgi:hypothetical protein
MGVDLMVEGDGLGKVPVAKCRAYRATAENPILVMENNQRSNPILVRRIFPLESLPLKVKIGRGKYANDVPVSDEHFAVDTTLFFYEDMTSKLKFNAWVTKEEYERLKPIHRAKSTKKNGTEEYLDIYNMFEGTSPYEWLEVCKSCPLSIPVDMFSCSPRMFSYGNLPLLRRAVGELATGPNREEVNRLAAALGLIIKPKKGADDEDSPSARQDAAFQMFFSMLSDTVANTGIEVTPKYIPESPPSSGADKLVDRLFFWDRKTLGWRYLQGKRLQALVAWFDQFVPLVEDTVKITGTSEEMKYFINVLKSYRQAIKQAEQYKLQVYMSW